jgi:hypothetical protein
MPPRRLRFRPPPVDLSPALGWVLARAFGPLAMELPPVEPAAALAAARRFELAARLAARLPRERWAAELGDEGAAELRRERIGAVAAEVRLLDLAREVAAAAERVGTPVALLKFAALTASGAAATGSRPACDVDLLAPAAGAAALHAALRARGWSASPLAGGDHQLAALASPAGPAVEIHLHLPGVRLPQAGARRAGGDRSATYEDLAAAGLLAPLAGWPDACRLPARAVLAAHALVHGIAQHGFAPDAYAQLKMIGDLIDLGLSGADGTALAELAGELVAADVSVEEVAAAVRLAAALAAGNDLRQRLRAPGAAAGEIALLRHALAGRSDARYRAALKLGLRPQPGDGPRALSLARAVWGTVFLSRAQVVAIYGRPAGRWGYLGRRLARPFDLALRLASYAAAARREPAEEGAPEPAPPSRILPPR